MSEQGADESSQKGSQYLLHLYRGSDLLLKEQVAEARQELEEASRIDPDDPKGLSLLGLVYFRLEEYELAQQIYELLVSRYPSEAPLRVNLGLVYMKQGRAGDARDEMLRAVEFDPNHQRAYGYLGLLHSEAGDHERARVAFAKAGQDAMVQRMEELLASHQQPPAVGPDPAVPAAVAKPAPGAPSQAAQAPGQMREAPPALSSMSVVSMEGAPMPSGAMPPMVSDAMTQPVAVPTGNGPDALAEDALGVDPFASWGAELNDQGDATPDAVQEQPSQGLGASDERGFGAAPPPVSVDWGVDSSPGIPMAAPSEPIETGGGGFAAPVDQAQVAPAPTVAGVMDWSGDPTMAAADAGSAQSEEVVGGLGSAAETSQSPEMAAPVEPPGPGGQPEPWVAEGLHRAGESFIAESEVSDALDQAVGPEEPWPTRTGVALPMQAPSDGTPEGSAAGIASSVAQPQAVQAVGARTDGLGPVPIFAFATTELVDLGARHERISCSSDGLLLFAIEEDGFFRADSLVAKVGDLKFEPAFRRAKGTNVEEPMEDRRGPFLKAKG
ncbi:MAG: tetratricopeptide repeat protein [Polyangia bacterium]|nr:tetratricopeptide repeat protein [Polyangia bacterium]